MATLDGGRLRLYTKIVIIDARGKEGPEFLQALSDRLPPHQRESVARVSENTVSFSWLEIFPDGLPPIEGFQVSLRLWSGVWKNRSGLYPLLRGADGFILALPVGDKRSTTPIIGELFKAMADFNLPGTLLYCNEMGKPGGVCGRETTEDLPFHDSIFEEDGRGEGVLDSLRLLMSQILFAMKGKDLNTLPLDLPPAEEVRETKPNRSRPASNPPVKIDYPSFSCSDIFRNPFPGFDDLAAGGAPLPAAAAMAAAEPMDEIPTDDLLDCALGEEDITPPPEDFSMRRCKSGGAVALATAPAGTRVAGAVETVEEPKELAGVDPELKRQTTVWYYNRMNPLRHYPLKVVLSKRAQKMVLKETRRAEGKGSFQVKADNPLVTLVPVFPGCLCSPAELCLDLTRELVQATLWITPLSAGRIEEARVEVWYRGKKVDEVATPATVTQLRMAKFSAACSVLGPMILKGVEIAGVDVNEKAKAVVPSLLMPVQSLGVYGTILMAAVVLLMISGLLYLVNKPRQASPVHGMFALL